MATPNEKLAASLTQLEKLQQDGRRVIRSGELTRVHRERLLKNGFLREVMKGWLISTGPNVEPGDTTPWFASFWEFCAAYCTVRFGQDWHLSPEQSLLLYAENTVIPKQVIVHALKGGNNSIKLLFDTSLYDLRQIDMPPKFDLADWNGLRLFALEAALCRVPKSFFARHCVEARVVLSGVRDVSEVLRRLLAGGHSAIAGWLAGAFRRIGRADAADQILTVMTRAGYDVRETDPFVSEQIFGTSHRVPAPIVERIQSLWEAMRQSVIASFPEAPGLPHDTKAYLSFVDEAYRSDAYHSLSIEGYRVTLELIERVRTGNWDPTHNEADGRSRDALAARGYWQAFQLVRETVKKIICGGAAGALVGKDHGDWYGELFQPSVAAGVINASALAGYRNDAVYLRGSRYVPPRWEVLRDAMPALFDLLQSENEVSVRAVLGHWLFGYIHPYPDGNGRMARFIMNAMLASGGYPWTVIQVEDRNRYLAALERASIDQEIADFALFLAERVQWSMEQGDITNHGAVVHENRKP